MCIGAISNGRAWILGAGCFALIGGSAARATNIFVETGGRVVAEAEHFSARASATSTSPDSWTVVDSTSPPVGTFSGTLSNGAAIQALPDGSTATGSGSLPDIRPSVDFIVRITTTGTYNLFIKGAGTDGNGDSCYAQIVELRDGMNTSGGTLADWYAPSLNSSASADAWSAKGAIESGTASAGSQMAFPINTAGDYTVRIMMRENGALIDKLVLQTSTTTPTGSGFAESTIVPEPATLGSLSLLAVGLLARRRQRNRA